MEYKRIKFDGKNGQEIFDATKGALCLIVDGGEGKSIRGKGVSIKEGETLVVYSDDPLSFGIESPLLANSGPVNDLGELPKEELADNVSSEQNTAEKSSVEKKPKKPLKHKNK